MAYDPEKYPLVEAALARKPHLRPHYEAQPDWILVGAEHDLATHKLHWRGERTLPRLETDCEFCSGSGFYRDGDDKMAFCPNGCADPTNTGFYDGVGWSDENMLHRQAMARAGGRVEWLDGGMVPLIQHLWTLGVDTWVSCQGHGFYRDGAYVGFQDDVKHEVVESVIRGFYGVDPVFRFSPRRRNERYGGQIFLHWHLRGWYPAYSWDRKE